MAITEQIQRLQKAKVDLKAKLIEKGVEVGDSLLISDYANLLDDIKTGINPTGTLDITNNGEYDVTQYAKVNVNVASSGSSENTLKKLLDFTKSTKYMFDNITTDTDLTGYIEYNDTSNVTSMNYMFNKCTNLTNIPRLDTSKVTSMTNMFSYSSALTTIPQLDTSNVTSMNYMFSGCTNLTNIPRLDTSEVTNMTSMFNNCKSLLKVDISYYNISLTNYTKNWCSGCFSLKAVVIRAFSYSISINSTAFSGCYHLLGTTDSTYNPTGAKDGYIYVPRNKVDTLKSATNWSTYADQIRALEDYTVDGTTTGELDESKI